MEEMTYQIPVDPMDILQSSHSQPFLGHDHKHSMKEIYAESGMYTSPNESYKVVCGELFPICSPLQIPGPPGAI